MQPGEDTPAGSETVDTNITGDGRDLDYDQLVALYDESMRNLVEGEIVSGTVIGITTNAVIIDIGYKSEGLVSVDEFKDRDGTVGVEVGDEVEVLLEQTEDSHGHVLLSKQKAERMRIWNRVEKAYKESQIITGRVIDRIKGGLTVDVGLRAFLPGSLVDIKPVKNLESFRGEELEFKVISLDRRRNNIVLSRKAVLEKEYEKKKKETLEELQEGAHMTGAVKNITDYGVFIDLGGIDGLLHITDISWGRVNHPSEHFGVGDEVDVVILKFDRETERVSLGYKQRSEDPWSLVDKKYPLGVRVHGKVVSLVDYGAFVELEEGVEGLIHVSEMSWTKKVVNPSKVLNVSDEVEAIVSELDMGNRRISLSLRQTEANPWEDLALSFPVGTIVEGTVRNLTDFGAFVEITEEIDGLIHVSDMSWTKRVKHPSEVLDKGDDVRARITSIDVDNQRVSLSIKEFLPNEWQDFIDDHMVGDTVEGRVVNITDFGLFVDIYEGLEGLAHISEIDIPGGRLEDSYLVGKWVRARVLRIDEEDHKVGLTMRGVATLTNEESETLESAYEEKRGEIGPAVAKEEGSSAPAVSTPVDDGSATLGDLAGLRIATADAASEPEATEEQAETAVEEAPLEVSADEAQETEPSEAAEPETAEPEADVAVEAAASDEEAAPAEVEQSGETAESGEGEEAAEDEKE
ncbi:MAG: 30S ribosomal protein S1 [Acidobacteriota bacterium]|nr:30S ribosomal protein S1 [Acidobacteriota bacterium]